MQFLINVYFLNFITFQKKIEGYKHEQDLGKTLNADQLEAVKKYDEVLHTLTFAQLLSQQFNVLSINHAKQAKKVARREAAERSQQEIAKFREALLIQVKSLSIQPIQFNIIYFQNNFQFILIIIFNLFVKGHFKGIDNHSRNAC